MGTKELESTPTVRHAAILPVTRGELGSYRIISRLTGVHVATLSHTPAGLIASCGQDVAHVQDYSMWSALVDIICARNGVTDIAAIEASYYSGVVTPAI